MKMMLRYSLSQGRGCPDGPLRTVKVAGTERADRAVGPAGGSIPRVYCYASSLPVLAPRHSKLLWCAAAPQLMWVQMWETSL